MIWVAYSVTTDESADVTDISQLAVFIRNVSDFQLVVKLSDLIRVKGTTGDDDFFLN
jgi:hypothetical protein